MRNNRMRKFIALCMIGIFLTVSGIPVIRAKAVTHSELENLDLIRYDGETFVIKTIHYAYGNNRFVSVKDMARAFAGTDRRFDVSISSGETVITTGVDYEAPDTENPGFDVDEYQTDAIRINPVTIDGGDRMYYSFTGRDPEGGLDLFINITDLAMAFDVNLYMDTEAPILRMDEGGFNVDLDTFAREGLYDEVISALVGDASTGEIFTAVNEDVSVSCASTTKLMTYLCIMDAVSAGEISLDDTVTVSENAAALSRTEDGVIRMNVGQKAKLKDLLYALLLPSSNEAALALAEHLDGTEDKFVERMNNKAQALFLSDATYFYNCHGLPEFSDNIAASKIQNHVSASDMFILASHILSKYPEIREITSTQKYKLTAFDKEVKNTNALVYNLPGTVGLKTGTTKASGSSLVAAYDLTDGEETKTVIAIEYGAEDAATRNTVTEILLRYGIECAKVSDYEAPAASLPDTAGELIKQLIMIRNRQP